MPTDGSPEASRPRLAPDGRLLIDGISYIPSSVLLAGIAKISFKDDRAFGVVDPRGESPRSYSENSELGFYFNDTRYLATWEIKINGESPIPLANQLRYGGSTVVFSMTNPDLPAIKAGGVRIPRDMLLIRRILTFVEDTLFENLVIRNFDSIPHNLEIEQWIGGRFDDIFEVRGYSRPKRGRLLQAEERSEGMNGSETVLFYEGLDHQVRSSHIWRLFGNRSLMLTNSQSAAQARIALPPKAEVQLKTVVSFDRPWNGKIRDQVYADLSVPDLTNLLARTKKATALGNVRIETDNAILNRSLANALVDVRMLLTSEIGGTLYPYAGIPWFSAPFGRDGIITAYQFLPWHPELAKGVLEYVWATLGSRHEPFTDEQPGKVFHEMRRGEMSNAREVPFIPYYGSVDSTPLALILLHEYVRWTRDYESLKRWWPEALRALEWVEKWGDPDHDGFLEYSKLSPSGLVNQGWKDSHDSIMHADGRLAQAPIRLCEVQAYAYRARMAMADLARKMGQSERAEDLRKNALRLKARFRDRYWNAQGLFVNLALDGAGAPCEVISSNMGHCLWGQILDASQADHVAKHLMDDAMFSGYGIRTLADTEHAYNPLSYHNGSVWPHDNSIILEGFRNYGKNKELAALCEAMIGVLHTSQDFRLPELFCGFRRRANDPPVPYQVACKPQAWAAGSIFLMIKSMLGLGLDPQGQHLVFHTPLLASPLNSLEIHGLRGHDWEVDLRIVGDRESARVSVIRSSGDVRVLTLR